MKHFMTGELIVAFVLFAVSAHATVTISPASQKSEDLIDISTINPHIAVEMRYATSWNFLGRPAKGYNANKCLLTKQAAEALSSVQKHVQDFGFSLLLFDCYRPQKAVSDFVTWTKDGEDQPMKNIFYPDEPKENLVERGYIADLSGHSRGSTVDLTLIKTKKSNRTLKNAPLKFQEKAVDCRKQKNIEETGQLDMGTLHDCFDKTAATADPTVSGLARKNRQILKANMEKFGFVNYPMEWWHFTLKDEPNKDQYFDYDVQ